MPAGRAGRGWEGLSRLGTVLAGVGLSRADAAGQSTSCPPWAKPGTGAGAGHAAPGGGGSDVNPACAGMIRPWRHPPGCWCGKPRVCGDDPEDLVATYQVAP